MTPSNATHLHFNAARKSLLLLAFVAIGFLNCKNKEDKPKETLMEVPMEEEAATTPTLKTGCYTYHQNGNEIRLEITNSDNPVAGNLSYAFAEKDKNTGTFLGEFKDNQLVATYTFQSEGLESKRQVAFMLKDKQLVEGYGEMNADGTMFKDVNSITYSSTMPLSKTDCE